MVIQVSSLLHLAIVKTSNSKMLALKLGIFLLIAVVLVGAETKKKIVKCSKAEVKEADNLVSLIFTLGRRDRKFPNNVEELKQYCKDHRNHLLKFEAYRDKCLHETPKQLVSVIIYSMRTTVNNYCKTPKSKRTQDILAAAQCINNGENTDKFNQCQKDFIDHLMTISEWDESRRKEKLPQFCCGYQKAMSCLHKTAIDAKCSEKDAESAQDFARSYFDGAVNTICGDYSDHSDACEKLKLIQAKKFKDRPKSPIEPLVEVISNF